MEHIASTGGCNGGFLDAAGMKGFMIGRRGAMLGATALAAGLILPRSALRAAPAPRTYSLNPAPARQRLNGPQWPETEVWGYNGGVPGPTIRVKQGETLEVAVTNGLKEPTTVHWHGVRLPNAMDGVPYLTQPPIAPGETFTYTFAPPDAGTYWYHSHFNSPEQIGRGLYGALIVEETTPPDVDRDIVWVVDDWRLDKDGRIDPNFAQPMDLGHDGRIGNTATINGGSPEAVPVRAGERIRLRLINAANARIFALEFGALKPLLIARDGHPTGPSELTGPVVLAPAQRADLILDMTGRPGDRVDVVDGRYGVNRRFRLTTLAYGPDAPATADRRRPFAGLPANPLPTLDLAAARKLDVVLEGGMHTAMESATLHGRTVDIRTLFRAGKMWAINRQIGDAEHKDHGPLLVEARRGETVAFDIANRSMFDHPMHLHGFPFRILERDGRPEPRQPWADTVLIAPESRARVAFLAEAAGDWLFHCHILEHHLAGMGAVLRVS